MNISKLPNKKPRFDEETLVCDKYWLPTELIAYVMRFFDFQLRLPLRLVSKKWYVAYDLYHRNTWFNDVGYVFNKPVTRRQFLNAFVTYGRRLHCMFIHTSILREILDVEPNFADLIPNVIWIRLTIDDGFSSQRWMGDFVAKLSKLRKIVIREYGFTADEHLADEMDKAIAAIPRLREVNLGDVDLDLDIFPGPNMKECASQIVELRMSIANIEPELVASTFTMFKSVRQLGLRGISGVDVLKEVTEMMIDEKSFPKLQVLDVRSEFDLSHADPSVNEDGSKVTAMDLYLKICSIRRPRFDLYVGFILGACSTTNSVLIEKEREFVISLGKISAEVLSWLELTHHTPSGDYDPLTTLFYESVPRFPRLLYLYPRVSPTASTGPRIIEALNNPFLLPHLVETIFYVDDMQSPEWNENYDPVDPSRGVAFYVYEKQYEDEMRMINENNDGVVPSSFLCDCACHKTDKQ